MFLVYEKNYLENSIVDVVEDYEFKLFQKREDAVAYMERKTDEYKQVSEFTLQEDESSETCKVFVDNYEECGEFHICLVELEVN